jgi:hypothetical protein
MILLFLCIDQPNKSNSLWFTLYCIVDVAVLVLTGAIWTSQTSSVANKHSFIVNTDKSKGLTFLTIRHKPRFSCVTIEAVATGTPKCPKAIFSRKEA